MKQIDPALMAAALRSNTSANGVGGGMVGSGRRGFQTNSQPTVQPQQGQSAISPALAQPLMQKLMGGGAVDSSVNTLGANPGGWSEAAFGTGGAPVGGSSAAGGGTSSLAAAGPWTALAAAIIGNEANSKSRGLRAEDDKEYAKDLLTGKVLTQDIEGKWGPTLDKWTGGKASDLGFVGDMKGGSEIASGRIGKGLKTFAKDGTIGQIGDFFKKLF